jgi:hypothetical protein
MTDKEKQQLIQDQNRKYYREYMKEYRQREGFKEKAKQYRKNWLLNRAMREIDGLY